ncbi:hypothetical protein KY335_04715 [Candidatus Woesearchaeota archaeon]|nr:hypothetical protein [Candidatus Woesearchaeota archaeon]MBW3014510.1 hypothetical protein [Candidatus Woesearchaeota archaeon]
MKKAQMEIMGLVVIVLILIVAMMFVLFFATREKPGEGIKEFDEELHSFNTVSALLHTNVPFRGLQVQSVIEMCMWNDIWVGPAHTMTPCEYSSSAIAYMLSNSLSYINQDYHLYVYSDLDPDYYRINIKSDDSPGLCTGDIYSATQPLTYAGGTMYVVLDICDKPRGEI